MLSCLEKCKELEVSCPCEDCRLWVPYEEGLNCIQQVIETNSTTNDAAHMDFRTVGKVLGVSGQRIHQIEPIALKKLFKKLKHYK